MHECKVNTDNSNNQRKNVSVAGRVVQGAPRLEQVSGVRGAEEREAA